MTVDDLIKRLRDRGTESEFFLLRRCVEEELTPQELAALAYHRQFWPLPRRVREWLAELMAMGGFVDGPPQQYRRHVVTADVELFADTTIPRARKRLIIGFTGLARRLMMPLACVLQYLPSDRFDVAVLKDLTRQQYLNGISGYAESLLELLRNLERDLAPADYAACCTYGTSAGGLPGLRSGILLGTAQAVCVGGRLPMHLRRLIDRRNIPAFDPLCACVDTSRTAIVCVYGADHDVDRVDAERVCNAIGARAVEVPAAGHNLITALWQRGQLRQFYANIFESDWGSAPANPQAALPSGSPYPAATSNRDASLSRR